MRYGIYNTASGQVSKVVTCSPSMAKIQCAAGESLFPDCPIDATWIVGGKAITTESIEEKLIHIRVSRNARLAACDWTQVPDAPVDKAAWAAYRQDLRDMPGQCNPDNPIWPIPPV